jgi:MFS family permease
MMHPRARLLLCVFAIALGGALVGIDIGIIATTIGQKSFTDYMFPPGTARSSSLLGAIVSMGSTGNVVGSLMLGFSLEKLGRKKTVAFATFFTIVGAVMQAAANGVPLMIVGRLVAGVAVGMLNGGLPVYISELAMPHERARLVGIFGLLVATGFCIANWVGYACSFATGNIAWRLELAMQIPLAVVLLGFSFIVPESPRWRKYLSSHLHHRLPWLNRFPFSRPERPPGAVPSNTAQAVWYT